MFKKLLLALGLLSTLALGPSEAQNTTCSDRPSSDSSNACANTRFVQSHGGGGGGTPGGLNLQIQYNNAGAFGGLTDTQVTARINVFTSLLNGAVPLSGGGITKFLRADGTWVAPGGSALVASIQPWAGATVPTSWMLAYGQAISRTTYSDLFTTITFNPTITCTNGSPNIAVTIATSDRVPIGAPIEAAACFTAGKTVIAKGAGSLILSGNAFASTSTSAVIFPWGNGNGSTTFNLPDLQGRALAGRDNMSSSAAGRLTTSFYGSNPDATNASGGNQFKALVTANLPPYTPSGTIGSASAAINQSQFDIIGAPGTQIFANSGVSITPDTLPVTASFFGNAQGGTSSAFATIQPSLTIDYIIKVLPDDNAGSGITVGVTTISGGATTNILYNNAGILGEYALATVPDMYAGTANNKIVTPSVIWPPEVTVTYGTTTTFNMSTFRDAVVTLTGNITTMTVSNVVVGKAGSITFIQDGTGSRTTVWDSKFKFAGGIAPILTTTPAAVDILNYECRTSTFCYAAMMNDVK